MAAVLASAAAAGAGLYWTGYVGDRRGSIEEAINASLAEQKLTGLRATVDQKWAATLTGTVAAQGTKDHALAIATQHRGVRSVVDRIAVQPNEDDVQRRLSQAFADAGLTGLSARVGRVEQELLATITGSVRPEQVPHVTNVVSKFSELARVDSSYQVLAAQPAASPSGEPQNSVPPAAAVPDSVPRSDPAAVESALAQRLRAANLAAVTGRVDADLTARLAGTVRSVDQKNKAIELALSTPGVSSLSETIQVVEPPAAIPAEKTRANATTPEPPPRTPPATAVPKDPARLEGEINRALRGGGLPAITAQVADDYGVTLKGSTTSSADKSRAFQITRQFKGVGVVKDRIFVVEQ